MPAALFIAVLALLVAAHVARTVQHNRALWEVKRRYGMALQGIDVALREGKTVAEVRKLVDSEWRKL